MTGGMDLMSRDEIKFLILCKFKRGSRLLLPQTLPSRSRQGRLSWRQGCLTLEAAGGREVLSTWSRDFFYIYKSYTYELIGRRFMKKSIQYLLNLLSRVGYQLERVYCEQKLNHMCHLMS